MTDADPTPPTRRALRSAGRTTEETGGTHASPDAAGGVVTEPLPEGAERPSEHDAAPQDTTAPRDAPSVSEATDPAPDTDAAPAAPGTTPEHADAAADHDATSPDGDAADATPATTSALVWVDAAAVASGSVPPLSLEPSTANYVPVTADLLSRPPRRPPWRPGVLVPLGVAVAVVVAYCAAMLLWPLHAVTPTVAQVAVEPIAAPAAEGAWPAEGGAAVAVEGFGGPIASTTEASSIASITKVVTALLVLDEMPLGADESGREFRFTAADNLTYWAYRARGESALDVPIGGALSERQMLEGLLIGSANNYADRLAAAAWPTDAVFARAANDWLTQRGLPDITIADPSGIDPGNTASPEALIALAARALADPVIAEIVRTPVVELPGAGTVENTNNLLADPGVVGVKTGALDSFNLLAAKDVQVGETTVRIYASALGQPDPDARDSATRELFDRVEQELELRPSVARGTVAGQVQTLWGEPVEILTASDAEVVLWNGATASIGSVFDLDENRESGDVVGTLTATGPRDTASVDLVLADEIEGPSPLWRLTHPLQLLGLD